MTAADLTWLDHPWPSFWLADTDALSSPAPAPEAEPEPIYEAAMAAHLAAGGRPIEFRQPEPGTVLCIIPGPSHEYIREPAGDRWCFKCRKRLPHDDVMIGDPPGVMSYYDPNWVRECSGCGEDHTWFPGTGPL